MNERRFCGVDETNFENYIFLLEGDMLFSKSSAKRVRLSSPCGCTVLAPYESEHVSEYNALMKDPQLQELTGSEPLSLEEEHEMLCTWQSDPDKLCLLIFSAQEAFVGDVNAFFREEDGVYVAEVSVMIARPSERQKGHASRALALLFDLLAKLDTSPAKLEARIKLHNVASIALFRKLGFTEESVSEAFGEVTMALQTKAK